MVKKAEAKPLVTGGEISYGRTVPTGDYASKRADVKLFFSLPEGGDLGAMLDAVAEEAKAKVLAMVGLKAVDPLPASDKVGADLGAVIPSKGASEKELAAQKLNEKDALAAKTAKTGNNVDPEKSATKRKEEAAAAEVEDAEDFGSFDESSDESQPEVTDEVLSQTLNAEVGRLAKTHKGAASKMARELIAKYVEPPKKSADIPQNLRHKFIAELKELK